MQSPLGLSKAPSPCWRAGKRFKKVLAAAALSAGGVLAGCGPSRDLPELRTGRTVQIWSDATGIASGPLRAVGSASINRAETKDKA